MLLNSTKIVGKPTLKNKIAFKGVIWETLKGQNILNCYIGQYLLSPGFYQNDENILKGIINLG